MRGISMRKSSAWAVLVAVVAFNLLVFQNCSDPGMVAVTGFSSNGTFSAIQSGQDQGGEKSPGLVDPETPAGKACASSKVLGQWGTDPEDLNAPNSEMLTFKDDCTVTSRMCGSKIQATSANADTGRVTLKVSESPGGMACVPDGTYTCDYELSSMTSNLKSLAVICGGGAFRLNLFSGMSAMPVDTTPTPVPTPTGPKRFWVTGATFSAKFGSAQSADMYCMRSLQAPTGLIDGRALLIDKTRKHPGPGWILHPNTTYNRTDGKLSFTTDETGAFDPLAIKVPAGDEKKMFWFGAQGGTLAPGSSSNCEDWTYDADNWKEATVGGDDFGNFFRANEDQYCNSKQHLLCVEM